MAEPGDALEVRVDDEEEDRDRPEPAHDRVELEDGDEEDRERRCAEREHLPARERPGRELAARRARVARVDLGVDQPVQAHRQRPGADHRHRDPEPVRRRGRLARARAASRRTRTGARTPCARASPARRSAAGARRPSSSRLPVCRLGFGEQAERVPERGLQHGIAVATAARRAREVDDQGARDGHPPPHARAAHAASSPASRRGSPPRSQAPRGRSPSASPRE